MCILITHRPSVTGLPVYPMTTDVLSSMFPRRRHKVRVPESNQVLPMTRGMSNEIPYGTATSSGFGGTIWSDLLTGIRLF